LRGYTLGISEKLDLVDERIGRTIGVVAVGSGLADHARAIVLAVFCGVVRFALRPTPEWRARIGASMEDVARRQENVPTITCPAGVRQASALYRVWQARYPQVLRGYAVGISEQLDPVVQSIGRAIGAVAVGSGLADHSRAIVLALFGAAERFAPRPAFERRTQVWASILRIAGRQKDVPGVGITRRHSNYFLTRLRN
jgi:hypothetical protein